MLTLIRRALSHMRAPVTLAVVSLLFAWSCSASAPFVQPALAVTRHANHVTFRYPARWSITQWSEPSSFSYMVAAVSNEHLIDPCFSTSYPRGTGPGRPVLESGCGLPVANLAPASVLLLWYENGSPGWSLAQARGSTIRVGGLAAKIEPRRGASDECVGMRADETIRVTIPYELTDHSAQDNYVLFVACLRGPGNGAERSTALAVLHSARFSF